MIIERTQNFNKTYAKLPISIQKIFQKQEVIFKQNWLDPRLHTKRIKQLPGVYSFRLTRRYRALFYFEMLNFAICCGNKSVEKQTCPLGIYRNLL